MPQFCGAYNTNISKPKTKVAILFGVHFIPAPTNSEADGMLVAPELDVKIVSD